MSPNWNHTVRQHLAVLRLSPEREIEIVEELALHLETVYEDALADGLSEKEAETRAVQSYDWRLLECELSRAEQPLPARVFHQPLEFIERRKGTRMESLLQDLRFGARMLLKQPGFTLIAIITLALGIGANAAIFSVVNAVLLRPLPYETADRLVVLWGNFQKLNIKRVPAKAGEYLDYRDKTQSFAEVAAVNHAKYSLTVDHTPERLAGASVTSNLFATLGAHVAQGRGFTPEDQQAGHDHVVIVSHAFWQQRYAGATDFIGRTLRLNGQPYTVIGIMPADFQYPHASLPFGEPAELWTPLVFTPEQISQRQGPYFLNVIAQLKPGVKLEQARGELSGLSERFIAEEKGYRGPKGEDGGWQITATPLLEEAVGQNQFALWFLLGAVGLVLLIACANVANLLLARGAVRQREFAIRAALGASRWQITRQLLCESLLLAGAGAVGGLLLAWWGVAILTKLKLDNLPRVAESSLDWRVLVFTLLLTLLTILLFGLAPAWQIGKAARNNLQQTLKGGSAAVTQRRPWLRNLLVVGEVALAVLLLVGAGLLINSLVRLQHVKPGLDIDKLLLVELSLPRERYSDATKIKAFTQDLIENIEALPGVEQASVSSRIPLDGGVGSDPFMIEGLDINPNDLPNASWQIITPGHFRTLGIPLLRGRDFTSQDGNDVAIINETMARKYWSNENALGKRLSLGLPRPENPYKTIIGIVADTPQGTLEAPPGRDCYFPYSARAPQELCLFVRAAGEPATLATAVRQQIWNVDKDQPVSKIRTMRELVSGTLTPRRFNTVLLSGFAVLALFLGALGIYSVLAFSVTERTQEIGVRLALGAQTRDVLALVIRQGMSLVAVGVAIGTAGALALTRLLKSLLFGINATDPLTFVTVVLLLTLSALLACWIPARRATKVDPMITLRCE
jgi:putative ABC transport system permease protein